MVEGFNPEDFVKKFKAWFGDYLKKSGAQGTISGLSGGIDSAVVAALLNSIIGDKHLCLFMDVESSKSDREDARLVASHFNLNYREIDLNEAYKALLKVFPEDGKVAKGNIKPRLRMIALYYFANLENRLVVGTGNRSELMVGYFTKYGDGACDILPIGSLYKSEVRILAEYLGIPEKIIEKKPSAGLWEGQTDEDELGITYSELDSTLKAVESGKFENVDPKTLEFVMRKINSSAHKRNMPVVFDYRES